MAIKPKYVLVDMIFRRNSKRISREQFRRIC